MKIVFCDIDGVLNTYKGNPGPHFSKPCIDNLKELLKNKDIKVVVSSAWRMLGLEKIKQIFEQNGINSDIIVDITGHEKGDRGIQIDAWLKRNGNPSDFVILDDDSDMKPHMDKLVQTNSHIGLTSADIDKAKKILKI